MKILALFAAVVALVLALAVAGPISERLSDRNSYQAAAERLQLERQAFDLAQHQAQASATLPARVLADYGLLLLLGVGAAGLCYVAFDGYRRRRVPLVRFGGELVARDLIESADPRLLALLADQVHARGVARIEEARRPAVPAHLTYAPHYSARNELAAGMDAPMLAPALASVPTFAQLLDQGAIGPAADGRAQPLLLGYNAENGTPIEGSWKSLYSAGIGALQGAGKSWLEAFLLSQSALQGARLIICDPHAGHDSESLASRIAPLAPAFLCDVAQSDREILAALKLANDELDQRKAGKGSAYPIVVAIDEWTSLLRGELGDVLPVYATNFAEQGRKFGVNALLSAQGWGKDVTGDVRNRLTSHYILRQRPDEARYQTGLRAAQLPGDIRTLPDATGYLLTVKGDFVKVVIPQMTAADLVTIGARLGGEAPSNVPSALPSTARPFGFAGRQPEGNRKANTEGTEGRPSAAERPAEHARIVALFVAGKTIPEIVKEVFHLDSNGGRAYVERRQLVEDVIRQAIGGAS